MDDLISRQAAINAIENTDCELAPSAWDELTNAIISVPPEQPFHNITMDDVLKYIDGMPEDVWQEFVACLEYRGWELQRRTAKWCGSEFA